MVAGALFVGCHSAYAQPPSPPVSAGQHTTQPAQTPTNQDWQSVHSDDSIQFAPVVIPQPKPKSQSQPPSWLKSIFEALGDALKWLGEKLHALFSPLAKLFGISWPVAKWILIGIAVICTALIVWRIVQTLRERVRQAVPTPEPEWVPNRDQAVALLEDADRLAAEGRYGEAAHLLLQRSVHHIATSRPDWLHPATTSREIATLPALPDRARHAFGIIAERVERSLFALKALDASDWTVAREAYADFALQRLDQPA